MPAKTGNCASLISAVAAILNPSRFSCALPPYFVVACIFIVVSAPLMLSPLNCGDAKLCQSIQQRRLLFSGLLPFGLSACFLLCASGSNFLRSILSYIAQAFSRRIEAIGVTFAIEVW